MEILTRIIETLFVLLILAGIYLVVKYPRDVFITLPLGILKVIGNRLYYIFMIVTFPVWGPLYLLDKYYAWGIFNARSKRQRATKELPDTEYDVERKLEIDFQHFDKFIITSVKSFSGIETAVAEGFATIQADFDTIEIFKQEDFHIVRISGIDLYSFHFIVQWMQNEFKGSNNFGFAKKSDFSFFCTCDKRTLNNLLGETSSREIYAYSLMNHQNEYLGINSAIDFRKRYTTNFFDRIIKSNQRITAE